jgi:hypothetical protein
MVVAVKLDVIKGGGDAIPTGHGSRFGAAHMRHGGHNDVAEAERFADQDNLEFDGSANRQLPGAEKINPCGADVASNESYGRFFRDSASAAKTQWEVESGARVFPVFGMDADGMRGNADETPRLSGTQKRSYAKGGNAREIRQRQGTRHRLARFRGRIGCPLRWNYTFRRAQIALRDATARSLAKAQQTKLSN